MGDPFGEGYRGDGEWPVHEVRLDDFWLDETAVTNEQFAAFVKAELAKYEKVVKASGAKVD